MLRNNLTGAARSLLWGPSSGLRKFVNTEARAPKAVTAEEGWLFVDSVFPIRLGTWDIRHYIAILRRETILDRLQERLSNVTTSDFQVISLEPHLRDGGVFVHFKYTAEGSDGALRSIESHLRNEIGRHGGVPSWLGFSQGSVWLVKGRPWREDMNRYPTTTVKVTFEGPDVHEEDLYHLFRPYGRISDISSPTPVPTGTLRSSRITFRRTRVATVARNVLHGFRFSRGEAITSLQTVYEPPIQAHLIQDWVTSHPRIVLPILLFLLGTLTYTVFNPVRAFFVEGKILHWFDYREYGISKWAQTKALGRLAPLTSNAQDDSLDHDVWRERQLAEVALKGYLSDLPATVAFVHGPQGTGKSRLVSSVTGDSGRVLVIDCAELSKAPSDARVVAALAQQTGYRPVFPFLSSLGGMIDIVSAGVIGQKAGLSSTLEDQLKQILEVVGTALRQVSRRIQNSAKRKAEDQWRAEAREADEARIREAIRQGVWHDPRLDCVAGVGVISELGVGDESFSGTENGSTKFMDTVPLTSKEQGETSESESSRRTRNIEEIKANAALPVVVIKNYAIRGRASREEIKDVLGQWIATLVENQVAHVIVVSDNRENAKPIARALPSKPLNFIALSDADSPTALSFVEKRLRDVGVISELTPAQRACIERLGGRASDLESLIHKVRNGQGIEESVEDIISRGISTLRKNAFGEDSEEARMLPWSHEQVWFVLKKLSQKSELPYYAILYDFPFRGDEGPLRAMEHAELISIATIEGRPSTIRPGKPVLRYVFKRLVDDSGFRAAQDLAFNEKLAARAETTIKSCESELATLREINREVSWAQSLWASFRASNERETYLGRKMYSAQRTIQEIEKQNAELKRTVAKEV